MAVKSACRYLFSKIQIIFAQHDLAGEDTIARLANPEPGLSDLDEHIVQALNHVSANIVAGVDQPPIWLAPLLNVLASATREQPFWRPLFGHPTQGQHDTGPDCVLEAARSLLMKTDLMSEDALLRPILRLIANCCADDNTSRSVLVHRGGIPCMKQLALQNRALDLLLPTLYNVCVDYDEIAVDESNQPLRLKDLDTSVELTKAEQALGSCLELTASHKTAVELFLNLRPSCDESSFGFLTDLAEMASRPALFGTQHIFSSDEASWPDQSKRLLDSLFTHGISVIQKDTETLQVVLQTVLNVLSQKQIQVALIQSSDHLLRFTRILGFQGEDDPDLQRCWESLIQIIYIISALPDFAELYNPASEPFSRLVKELEEFDIRATSGTPYQQASLVVLLANALTTPDHIAQCLSRFPDIPELAANILHTTSGAVITVPTLDLAGRLALDPAGQSRLLNTDILKTLNQMLQPASTTPTQSGKSHTFTIHREAVALTRLLIKSPPANQPTPPPPPIHHPSLQTLHSTILTLFITTLDTSTKLEIGRYTVEVLRNTNTSTTAQTQLPTAPLLPPLLHLTTDSPTSASRAEGVFGLGLLFSRTPDPSSFAGLVPAFIEQGPPLLGALTQMLDAAAAAAAAAAVPVDGSDDDSGARTRRAEAENAKLVVVRLLLALRGDGGVGEGDVEMRDGFVGEGGEQEDRRAEFVRGLEELVGRLGIRA